MTEIDEATHDPSEAHDAKDAKSRDADAEAGAAPASKVDGAPELLLNADGRERPAFLLEFPDDPELQRLVRAFEAGNYQAVRIGAPELAEASDDAKVRGAARELRRRIDPDPLMKYLLWVALALLVFVSWYTYQNHSR